MKSSPETKHTTDHFSYSQWRVFKYEGPRAYALKYIYWLTGETNPRMTLGKQVAEMVERDEPNEDATLDHLRLFLPQYPLKEYPLEAKFNGVKLVGKPDGLNLETKTCGEHKTGVRWNQAMADCVDPMSQYYKNGAQLTWYALLLHLTHGWKPEEIRFELNWMPTIWDEGEMPKPTGEIKTFITRRTTLDVFNMGKDIIDTWKKIGLYCADELRAIGQ